MAEEKKTSPKAEKKADKPEKSTKSKDKKSKKNPFKSIKWINFTCLRSKRFRCNHPSLLKHIPKNCYDYSDNKHRDNNIKNNYNCLSYNAGCHINCQSL